MIHKITRILLVAVCLSFYLLSGQNITISELNYNDEGSIDSGDWLELYNYGTSSLDISGYEIKDGVFSNSYFIPGGTILASGQRKIIARDPVLFNTVYPSISGVLGPMSFGFDNITDQINLRNAQGQALLSFIYLDSLPWPRGADGTGRTLELLDPLAPLTDPANWFDGCIGGSPGTAYSPCNDPIVFSEIMYNVNPVLPTENWVELHNTTSSAINLSGWIFRDGRDTITNQYIIPAGTIIPANGYLVLSQLLSAFLSIFPSITNVLGDFTFNLDNNGEQIRLFDQNGTVRMTVIYDDLESYGWPLLSDGQGYSLELLDANGKMNEGSNWFAGCFGGSPGLAYNADCCDSPLAPTSASIMGSNTACNDGLATYSTTGPDYLIYQWSLTPANSGSILSGQGTQSIEVNWNTTGAGQVLLNVSMP